MERDPTAEEKLPEAAGCVIWVFFALALFVLVAALWLIASL